MGFVYHGGPDSELVQVPHHPLGVSSSPATAAALGGTCTEQLRFRDHRHRRRIDPRTVLQLGDGHRESGAARDEIAPRLDELRLQTVRAEGLQQNFPPPRRLGDDEASPRMRSEEVLQEADRSFRPSVDGERGWRLRGERDDGAALVLGAAAQAHAGIGRQPGEQILDRNENFVRRQHGTLAVVTPVAKPVAGVLPERPGRVVDVFGQDHDRTGREVVDQGGGLTEEQRQVVLDARGPAALTDFPIDRAARRVALEAPSPRAPESRHRILGGRELAGGEELDAIDPARRALAVGIEDAQALDLVVEQVDAQRRIGTHRKEIEQRAPHRVLPMLHHLADTCIPGPVQTPAKGVDVEAVAPLDPEPVAVDEFSGGNPSHRRGGDGDQNPRCERWQPRKCFEPFRDDVLVRREEVVGQRLPVGKSQPRGFAVEIELQLGFEAVSGPAVRGDDEHRCIGLAHEACDGKAAGAAVQRRPPGS